MSVNQPPGFVKPQAHTNDAFLGGKLSVLQPRSGFRAGLDSVLLGASVPEGTGKLLDLGAGAGVAALCALEHNHSLNAVLAEIDPATAELARQNVESNGFGNRADVLTLDVLASGLDRKRAGLGTDLFDVVIANPPYFATGTLADDKARAGARHMDGDFLDGWVKTAVSAAHARGLVIFIHTVEALPQLLSSFASRTGGIAVLPLCPRPGMAASRVLVKGQKGSRAPLRLLPPLALHGDEGNGFAPAVDAVFRGTGRLDWHMEKQVPISGDTDTSPRTN
jgi:tRNA1(Val) A37 N6-methylase TrmN6